MDKQPKNTTTVSAPAEINTAKVANNNIPNLQSFSGVRTTINSNKEGRLKVDAGQKKKKSIIKKIIGKYK